MDRRGSWRYAEPAGGRTSLRTSLALLHGGESIARMVIDEENSSSAIGEQEEEEKEEQQGRQQKSTSSSSSLPPPRLFPSNPFVVHQERVVVAMVGLPARGKSYLSNAIIRYLRYLGCPAQLFNAGDRRRKEGMAGIDKNFFDSSNKNAKEQREQMAMDCLDDLLDWLQETSTSESSKNTYGSGCAVGIFDATNTTIARREKVMDRVKKEVQTRDPNVLLVFVESITNNEELLEWNYKMKLSNKDYEGMDPVKALNDFKGRVKNYEAVYEPLKENEHLDSRSKTSDQELRYIKLVDAGKQLVSNNLKGLVMRKIQRLLGSIHLGPRNIYLVLVGETKNDVRNVLGGDTDLSEEGREYAKAVSDLLNEKLSCTNDAHAKDMRSTTVMTTIPKSTKVGYIGTLKRYNTMAQILDENSPDCLEYRFLSLGAVNELSCGDLEGLTEEHRDELYPKEQPLRRQDPLNYRYPGVGGESYVDVVTRSNDTVCYLEQSRGDSIVISDRTVLKCLYGYFMGSPIETIPNIDIPPNTVIQMRRSQEGFSVDKWTIPKGKSTMRRPRASS